MLSKLQIISEQHLESWNLLHCTTVLGFFPILEEWEPLKAPEFYIVSVSLIAGTGIWFQINCYKN